MLAQKSEEILKLRAIIAQKEGHVRRGRYPSSSLMCGIPKGAITEIAGTAKIEWVLQFLKENPSLKVFWAERKFTLLPPALLQRGLHPNRFIFAECGDDLFVNFRKAIRCQAFECLVAPSHFQDVRLLKAVQLMAERSQSSVLLLGEKLGSWWPISVQFEVNRVDCGKSLEVCLKKDKGGGDPVVDAL